ncbi:MAG: dihydroorotate dehydrogenase 2 [Nitrososphaeria archaeon]|nr:dihydroorotate dehydrogenase 2 [Nitrososphaeria archaeon]MDW8043709.1 dihydroorotate dehydrogenase 2 [Nitrososphaerota archaeon]
MLTRGVHAALSVLPPELSHRLGLSLLRFARRVEVPDGRLRVRTKFGELANPIGLAAGFDKNGAHLADLEKLGFGYLVAGTFTREPRKGNPGPRLVRLRSEGALLNAMGFPNPGIDEGLEGLRRSRPSRAPVVVSVSGVKLEDLAYCYERAQEVADAVEVNVSSPNTPALREYLKGNAFRDLCHAIAPVKRRPTYLKVPPPVQEVWDAVLSALGTWVDAGFEGVTAINTLPVQDRRLSTGFGGLSGRPLLELTFRAVSSIRGEFGEALEVNAVGGVFSGRDVFGLLTRGATTVQLYTALAYRGPYAVREILRELVAELERSGCGGLEELRGSIAVGKDRSFP